MTPTKEEILEDIAETRVDECYNEYILWITLLLIKAALTKGKCPEDVRLIHYGGREWAVLTPVSSRAPDEDLAAQLGNTSEWGQHGFVSTGRQFKVPSVPYGLTAQCTLYTSTSLTRLQHAINLTGTEQWFWMHAAYQLTRNIPSINTLYISSKFSFDTVRYLKQEPVNGNPLGDNAYSLPGTDTRYSSMKRRVIARALIPTKNNAENSLNVLAKYADTN